MKRSYLRLLKKIDDETDNLNKKIKTGGISNIVLILEDYYYI